MIIRKFSENTKISNLNSDELSYLENQWYEKSKILFNNYEILYNQKCLRNKIINYVRNNFVFIIGVGFPGAGKTTFLKSLFPNDLYICYDEFIHYCILEETSQNLNELDNNLRSYYNKKISPILSDYIKSKLSDNESIVFDSNFISKDSRQCVNNLAKNYNSEFWIFLFPIEFNTCITRLEKRNKTNSSSPKANANFFINLIKSFSFPKNNESDLIFTIENNNIKYVNDVKKLEKIIV